MRLAAAAARISLLLVAWCHLVQAHPGFGGEELRGSSTRACRPGDRSCFKLSCPPGQGRHAPNEPCSLCPYGFFNPGGVYGPCLRCPPNSVTIAPGATTCGCRPGTGTLTVDEGPCMPCANGTYSAGGSMSPCLRCPVSGFMVTPQLATRVSQCTCKPGFGSTTNSPLACQMCPRGTYANALAQIIDIPGVPPQGGKGITRGFVGATVLPCTPCCPGGVGTCSYTTLKPGATSFNSCVLVPPNEPQPAEYCCGGTTCSTPVPVPPTTLPANAVVRKDLPRIQSQVTAARATPQMPRNVVQRSGEEGFSSSRRQGGGSWSSSSNPRTPWGSPGELAVCAANPRIAVTTPTGISDNTPWMLFYFADLTTSPATCPYTGTTVLLTACTGSQLAPQMVLTAAHCVDPAMNQVAACPNLQLVAAAACYDYNRTPPQNFVCPTASSISSVGVSWFLHPTTVSPNDQAIVFLSTARPAPFYQYNYMENVANTANNTFQSLSYVGDGSTGRCGCVSCPDMTCGVAQSGPAPGPLTSDTNVEPSNGAVNAQLESCGGASGAAMTLNGGTCAIATNSYEYPASTACGSSCTNYWSSISSAQPLSALWSSVQVALPVSLV